MIDTHYTLESLLQKYRFSMVQDYLVGDVLDFGGNEGELGKYVTGDYTVVNYDHTLMKDKMFDSIISLAVLEHIEIVEVFRIFESFQKHLKLGGHIFLTTPAPKSKPFLELLSSMGFLEKQNIDEHKHYWNTKDISILADRTGFVLKEYFTFQYGFNQAALLVKNK